MNLLARSFPALAAAALLGAAPLRAAPDGAATGAAPEATAAGKSAPSKTARGEDTAGSEAAEKPLPDAHPISLRAALDHPQITLGQTFALVIDVVHDPADTYALPSDLAAQLAKGSLELRGEPQLVRTAVPQGARTTLTLPLTDVASMEPSLPALELEVQGPSGARRLRLPEQPLSVESLVAKEGERSDARAHHGPKPPEQIEVRSYLWLWLLLALAALGAVIYAWRKVKQRAAKKAEAPPPPELPESEAVRRLRALRERAPWNRGEGRAAIFELSEIVRSYLGKQLAFNAVDLTSDELVRALRAKEVAGFDLAGFTARVQWEDLVKFAKLEPSAEECLSALEAAGNLVELVRVKLEAQRHADLVASASNSAPAAGAIAATPNIATQNIGMANSSKSAAPPEGAR